MSTSGPPAGFEPSYGSCTEVTKWCPIQSTIYGSFFNFPAMLFFSILYLSTLILHLFLCLRYRTFSSSSWIVVSALMEMLGHVARTAMHFDPWSLELLSLQICTLLWGPSLTAAGVSVAFKHMVHYCGAEYSVLRPSFIPWVFVGTDVVSVTIQGVGGIIASVSTGDGKCDSVLGRAGESIMIAGVCLQIANMLVCSVVMLIFWRRYQNAKKAGTANMKKSRYDEDKMSDAGVEKRFTWFARGSSFAFGMVALALVALAAVHPGTFFPVLRKTKRDRRGVETAGNAPVRKNTGPDSADGVEIVTDKQPNTVV